MNASAIRSILADCDGDAKTAASRIYREFGIRVTVAKVKSLTKETGPTPIARGLVPKKVGRRGMEYSEWEAALRESMIGKPCEQTGAIMHAASDMIVRHKIRRTDAPDMMMKREGVWVTLKKLGQPEDVQNGRRIGNKERIEVIRELFGHKEAEKVRMGLELRGRM